MAAGQVSEADSLVVMLDAEDSYRPVTVAAVRGDGADDRLATGAGSGDHLDRSHHVLFRLCGGGGLGALA